MVRFLTIVAIAAVGQSLLAAGPVVGPGESGVAGVGGEGASLAGFDPCDRGTIFNALKVVRAYRDNEAFAFKHLEGKRLQISGRLVAVKRDTITAKDPATGADVIVFDGYVALVTPDGKPPTQVGLEFRFPIATLRQNADLACALAELFPGQFVTLRGLCVGGLRQPGAEYVGVVFNDSELAP